MIFESGLDPRLVAHQQELELVVTATSKGCALDHHAHAFVAAHRINSDTRQTHPSLSSNSSRLKADCDDLTTVVEAAVRAQIVRTLQLTAVRTLVMSFDLQRIMRTAITTTVGRYFSLGDSHSGTCSSNKSINL